jgi:very-short-patch-repair endonuclease
MKNQKKVIDDRINKIKENSISIINYYSHDKIRCVCDICKHEFIDNYRNLGYKNFKCRYCVLISKSKLIKNKIVDIIKIDDHGDGAYIYLRCNKRGHEYKQDRRNLLADKECNQCYLEEKSFDKEYILNQFNRIHGDFYEYNMEDYKNVHTKIKITCKKGHTFLQKVSNHLQGKGCPKCRESLGERTISKYLNDNGFIYENQKIFKDCKYVSYLPFDFYIKSINLLIEYDGIQHSEPVNQFGGELEFEKTKIKDSIKNDYCIKNGINLLRISYKDDIISKLNRVQEYIVLQC